MRTHGYTLRSRRGIGSILGGAFLVLIMLIGYTVYTFSIQAINDQQQVLSDMRAYDIERSREAFKSDSEPLWSTNHLNVSIQNIGPMTTNIIWIGIWNGTHWNYSLTQVQVLNETDGTWGAFNPPIIMKSGSYQKFGAIIPGVKDAEEIKGKDWTYRLQFLTDKGTIFEVGYPDSRFEP
jgi:hypothetical protein